jgi:hypothetical protein
LALSEVNLSAFWCILSVRLFGLRINWPQSSANSSNSSIIPIYFVSNFYVTNFCLYYYIKATLFKKIIVFNPAECLCPPALANPRHGIQAVTRVIAYVADAVTLWRCLQQWEWMRTGGVELTRFECTVDCDWRSDVINIEMAASNTLTVWL